jgi:hypothetical protein
MNVENECGDIARQAHETFTNTDLNHNARMQTLADLSIRYTVLRNAAVLATPPMLARSNSSPYYGD